MALNEIKIDSIADRAHRFARDLAEMAHASDAEYVIAFGPRPDLDKVEPGDLQTIYSAVLWGVKDLVRAEAQNAVRSRGTKWR